MRRAAATLLGRALRRSTPEAPDTQGVLEAMGAGAFLLGVKRIEAILKRCGKREVT